MLTKCKKMTKSCMNSNHYTKKIVFCPIDKAANNVAIICKRLYVSVILKELDFGNINDNNCNKTYEMVNNMSSDNIVKRYRDFQKTVGLELDDDMNKLPPLHWTPKMHKTPVGARFIIGSKMCSLKPLGKNISKIFKVLFHHKRRYYRKAGFFSGLKNFWCIDSNSEITDTLDRISRKKNAKSISTFDFSTLYTKIPHDKLIEVLTSIVKSTFNTTTRKFMSVGNKRGYWVKGIRSKRVLYTADMVINCLKFLINNAYFRIGNHTFRQIIGIPMGSDPAPFFANLFLFHYECKCIGECKKYDYGRALKFRNTFRFIDDLMILNDNGEFEKFIAEIYPPELVLKKENTTDNKATFLDLQVEIYNGQFDYQLYDKRNAFPFYIVRFPYKCSNIPH